MPKTEKLLAAGLILGIAACLGVMWWPAPKATLASGMGIPARVVMAAPDMVTSTRMEPSEAMANAFVPAEADQPVVFSTGLTLLGNEQGLVTRLQEAGREAEAPKLMTRRMLFSRVQKPVADFNNDGALTEDDFFQFEDQWVHGEGNADFNHDGTVDGQDYASFMESYNTNELAPQAEATQVQFGVTLTQTPSSSEDAVVLMIQPIVTQ